MVEPKHHVYSRRAGLAAVLILLVLCLVLLGSLVAAAQEQSSPTALEEDPYDLQVDTWHMTEGTPALSGGVAVYGIWYQNAEGAGLASGVVITDVLPPGTIFVDDTAGFPVSYDDAAGTVIWDLGAVEPGQDGIIWITLGIEAPAGTVIDPNQVSIGPIYNDSNVENNEGSSGPMDVIASADIDLEVGKEPEPGDPLSGEEFQYRIDWCNHSEVSVGPVTLTDTLPVDVSYVDLYLAQPWQNYWNLISADDLQVVLEAPGVPAGWCQQLYLVLLLDEGLPMGTQLVNHVEIQADGDGTPGNNTFVSEDAFVSPLRADLMVDKQFNGGETYPGGWIEYAGRYWNQGNVAVEGWLEDTLPPGTTYRDGSAHFDGEQIDPIGPPYGDVLEWNLGTVPVNQGADFSFIVDITGASAEDILTNHIEISHDQTETTPWDNESSAAVQIFGPGPNLHVEKWSQWNYEQIHYSVFVANLGDEQIFDVVVTDTYPLGTTWAEGPGGADHLEYNVIYGVDYWTMEIPDLQVGESGWVDFNLEVLSPGARPAWYTNTIEISGIMSGDDVNPGDNYYEDVLVIPELDNVGLWLEPDGRSNMWGEAQVGAVVTVTTPAPGGVYTTTVVGMDECPTCWGIEDTGIVEPGDTIIVEAGAALMPLEFQVPDPFTAALDRESDPNAVRGVIDGWEEQPVEVRGWWEGGSKQVMTDGSGAYEALYEEPIPPGAQGATYFETMVNFSRVSFYRHFRDMSLILQVNYDHDWIQGEYELGHTVYLTVEKPAEFSPVYTVTLTTQEGVGEYGGFSSDWGDWHPERPNLEPHDLVYGRVDNGYEASLEIGTITGMVDADNDSIAGTVEAIWLLTEVVDVECQPWGGPESAPSKWSSAPTNGDPGYSCSWDPDTEWDVQPGEDIAVSYYEPAGHQVFGVFSTPWMRVNYGDDWVGGNYPVGATFAITVTESDESTVKGTAEVVTTSEGGWGGPGFETHDDNWIGQKPDIQPGDYVYFSTEGYDHVVRVGTIEGDLNVAADSIGGQIFAPWFVTVPEVELEVECHPWSGPGEAQPQISSAGPDGDPEYFCDWASVWDIQRGQDVGVMYIEPDDADRVINSFHEPAPDMSVNKWPQGGDQFEPGGLAIFVINWSNDGEYEATSVTMTDTLPSGVTYVMDTSGFAHEYDESAGTVVWEFGDPTHPVEPGEWGEFQLVVQIPADPAPELLNVVDIFADFDLNPDNDHAEATISLDEGAWVKLNVGKDPSPGDPTPGSTYVYQIHYGNNGSVPTGPATLTDILPPCTSVVDWYSQNGYDLWSVDTLSPNFVLTAPTLPGGGWGDQIILRLRVDEGCTEEKLANTVELAAEGTDTVSFTHEWVWLSDPYWNVHLDKNFGWGMLVPGGEIGYDLHVANHGNMTATVSLTDYLPAGTTFNQSWSWDGREYVEIVPSHLDGSSVSWEWGELPPGAWFNINLQLDIDQALGYGIPLTNCAEIVVAEGDREPFDNESCRSDYVREPGPNLRIYKDYSWNTEGQIRFEIYFQNVGTDTLEGVEIVDTLPEYTTFDGESWGSDFEPGIGYSEPGGNPTWTLSELQPGWNSNIWFIAFVTPDKYLEEGVAFTNTVTADIPGDKWPGDNTAEVTAYTGPDIWIKKYLSDGEPRPGELVTFTVEFGNRNKWPWSTDPGAEEPQTTVSDTLPDELTFETATAPWNPDEEWLPGEIVGNTLYWGWGPMDPESWWSFQIVARVSEEAVEDEVIVNTVQAWSNGADIDPVPANNTFHLYITILPPNYYVYLPVILKNY